MQATAPEPAYARMKRHIVDRIRTGELPPHARLPSEGELTKQFGVSRMTANRAMRELTDAGLVTRVPGLGSFVSPPKTESTMLEVKSIRDEAQNHSAHVERLASIAASEDLSARFEVAVGAPLFHVILVHASSGVPIQIEDRYVNPVAAPDFLSQDFTLTTPHDHLIVVAPLQAVEHVLEAGLADAVDANRLRVASGSPLLILNRRTWSRGHVASAARLVHPGDRYRLIGRITY